MHDGGGCTKQGRSLRNKVLAIKVSVSESPEEKRDRRLQREEALHASAIRLDLTELYREARLVCP